MQLIFCDESCHLEHDDSNYMVLGAISCPENKKQEIYNEIKQIKTKHNLSENFEIKWTKVSKGKIEFYEEIIDYFFKTKELHFRTVVASKENLKFYTDMPGDDYPTWYYKIYFLLLNSIIFRDDSYKIFIDIKDSLGGERVKKLKEVLCNNIYDFKGEVIKDIIQIHSHSSQILQITDLLIGAMSYNTRKLSKNQGKLILINKIKERLNPLKIDIEKTTRKQEEKFNIFYWTGGNR